MIDTPRTDNQELAYEAEDGSTYVHTTFARKLERENNELLKDKERLDWLADVNNHTGQVLLPAECVQNNLSSLRDAIDEAMGGAR